jgi:hypothetical protein
MLKRNGTGKERRGKETVSRLQSLLPLRRRQCASLEHRLRPIHRKMGLERRLVVILTMVTNTTLRHPPCFPELVPALDALLPYDAITSPVQCAIHLPMTRIRVPVEVDILTTHMTPHIKVAVAEDIATEGLEDIATMAITIIMSNTITRIPEAEVLEEVGEDTLCRVCRILCVEILDLNEYTKGSGYCFRSQLSGAEIGGVEYGYLNINQPRQNLGREHFNEMSLSFKVLEFKSPIFVLS